MTQAIYQGVFPVVPTIFDDVGRLDLPGQRRAVDFMIDAGSHGICILANFSEQFSLSDDERLQVQETVLEHVAGRVPVIVTTTHFSSHVCARRSRAAQEAGAAMIMVMPPYHGATFRVGERTIREFFRYVSEAVDIPVMIQDAPVAGTPLSVALLSSLAQETEHIRYFKIETYDAAAKLRELIDVGGPTIVGPWGGQEGITLLPELEAGSTGIMSGGGYPDGIRRIFDSYRGGNTTEAGHLYRDWLPLINYENRQCGIATCKILMKAGGVIRSDAVRHPMTPVPQAAREGLLNLARPLDPLVLRWAR